MERFNKVYPFTTENIAGYMDMDLTGKKIITVTGSGDHIINAILKGCNDITTFDINPLTKEFMELKLEKIKELSLDEYLEYFSNLDEDKYNYKYFDIQNKIDCNLYLNEVNYNIIKERLDEVKINFIESNVIDLELSSNYDYMFLSNISDYIEMFCNNLVDYKKLIDKFLERVKTIYFAYIYDINSTSKRSAIDDIDKVKEVFGKIQIKKFKTALINVDDTLDAVLIKEA
ncbi:MAG: DUF3419 family protein [Bacilli bacterium]|nr:DUF3419 family protein [Bacilli bacterium]